MRGLERPSVGATVNDLCKLVAATLKLDLASVGPETGPGTEPRWDSFNHVHLMMAVEDRYGVELEPDEIAGLLSVSDIASMLHAKSVDGFDE